MKLPTDEEIEQEAFDRYYSNDFGNAFIAQGFKLGAQWCKEKSIMKLPTDEEIEADPLLGGLKASDVFGPLKARPLFEQCCGHCQFASFPGEAKRDFSACRRYPPVRMWEVDHYEDWQPIVYQSDWCGEWKEKE